MSGYSPAEVAVFTASQDASTNALLFPLIVHKVILNSAAPATTIASASLFDAATATGTAKIVAQTHLFAAALASGVCELTFDPPVPFNVGLSTTIAGSSGVRVTIFYSRP